MVQGYKCDRCGDFRDDEPAGTLSADSNVFDLCPGCVDDAIDWMGADSGSALEDYGG